MLLGVGHAHLHLCLHARRFRDRGMRLTVVDPGSFAYSGLATGVLGGAFAPSDDRIDPERLLRGTGAELRRDHAVALDRAGRTVRLGSGAVLPYDRVSLNVGSEVALPAIADDAKDVYPVKPIANLFRLRERLEADFLEPRRRPLRVLVIGGGTTGPEVAASVAELARRHSGARVACALLTSGRRLLATHSERAGRRLTGALFDRGVEVHFGRRVARVERGRVLDARGARVPYDRLVVATGLVPARWLAELGLPLGDAGGLRVGSDLASVGDPRVFAAGDCADLEGHALPRLGVYGVRQAPVLLANLSADEGRETARYRPQRRALSILDLGRGEGLALWGRLHWRGRASLVLKRRIDLRFLARYRGGASSSGTSTPPAPT